MEVTFKLQAPGILKKKKKNLFDPSYLHQLNHLSLKLDFPCFNVAISPVAIPVVAEVLHSFHCKISYLEGISNYFHHYVQSNHQQHSPVVKLRIFSFFQCEVSLAFMQFFYDCGTLSDLALKS